MFRNNKNSKISNVLFAILCILLVFLLGGLLKWTSREDAREAKELQQLIETQDSSSKKAETKQEEAVSKEKEEKKPEEKQEEKLPEVKPEEAAEEESAKGIACWGDDLMNAEESATYSYRAVLQKLLAENGYDLAVADKTLQGAGTLSMMTMAGVPSEEVQGFIESHKAAANGGELYITETGIRDLTPEQLDRSDAAYIPVISMGYYGGWSHDPKELAQQQEKILNTFENKEKYIIVGVAPIDGSVSAETLDGAMKEVWGEHYISAQEAAGSLAASYEGQQKIAEAVLQKMEELTYIAK